MANVSQVRLKLVQRPPSAQTLLLMMAATLCCVDNPRSPEELADRMNESIRLWDEMIASVCSEPLAYDAEERASAYIVQRLGTDPSLAWGQILQGNPS